MFANDLLGQCRPGRFAVNVKNKRIQNGSRHVINNDVRFGLQIPSNKSVRLYKPAILRAYSAPLIDHRKKVAAFFPAIGLKLPLHLTLQPPLRIHERHMSTSTKTFAFFISGLQFRHIFVLVFFDQHTEDIHQRRQRMIFAFTDFINQSGQAALRAGDILRDPYAEHESLARPAARRRRKLLPFARLTCLHAAFATLPCSAADHALKNEFSVGRSQNLLARPVRVRHQAGHVALGVANTGDIQYRAVRIRAFRECSPLMEQYCHRICLPAWSVASVVSSAK